MTSVSYPKTTSDPYAVHTFSIAARNAGGYPYLGWIAPPGVELSGGSQYFTIHSAANYNKCLDVYYLTLGNGGKVQLWDCNGTDLQKWYVGPGSTIRNKYTNRCLDADYAGFINKRNGTIVQQWQCNGQNNQVWHWNSNPN